MSAKPGIIRVAGLVRESIVDGPGIRFVVFAQGCPHRCEGCHNEAALDFSGGYELETGKIMLEIEKNPLLSGVTFSGGEPFCQPEGFLRLARKLKEKNTHIISYSGYSFEDLEALAEQDEDVKELLGRIDILIDGRFAIEERDLALQFKGSANQRYIDMNATRESGGLVVLDSL
ncbi:MAG: anaerobic ribonucleoside-triphosphate reductase activating protein [Clostridiales bacterium]|nr:anaerobic ribonucleoside-triphosphate reductase activating protein [Clostridiales bacterium]